MASADPADVGTLIKFECDVGGGYAFRGVGRVVWNRQAPDGDDKPSGMAIKFVKLEAGASELIERIVSDHGPTLGDGPNARTSLAPVASGAVNDAPTADAPSDAPPPSPEPDPVPKAQRQATHEPRGAKRKGKKARKKDKAAKRKANSRSSSTDTTAPQPARPVTAPQQAPTDRHASPARQASVQSATPARKPEPPLQPRSARSAWWLALAALFGLAAWWGTRDRGESTSITLAAEPPGSPVLEKNEPELGDSEREPTSTAESAHDGEALDGEALDGVTDSDDNAATDNASDADTDNDNDAVTESDSDSVTENDLEPTADADASYVLQVITTPRGAQVNAGKESITAPGQFRRTRFDEPVKVHASKSGYRATAAIVDRNQFQLQDGVLTGRVYLRLQPEPKR